jgi:hypothetical protein
MRRERIEKMVPKGPRKPAEVLPLDPRDPDILRAKGLLATGRPRLKAA